MKFTFSLFLLLFSVCAISAQNNLPNKTDSTKVKNNFFTTFDFQESLKTKQQSSKFNLNQTVYTKPKTAYNMPIDVPKGILTMPNYFTESDAKATLIIVEID